MTVEGTPRLSRPYRSSLRARQTQATRTAVVDAATRLFAGRGYAATTMRDVAREAGVSVETVYGQGSKAALLLAAVDRALVGDDQPVPLADRPAFAAVRDGDASPEALAGLRQLAVERLPASAPLLIAFERAGDDDPAVREAWLTYEHRRLEDCRALVHGLLPRLRLDEETAADLLWALLAPTSLWALHEVRGWPVERVADWLVEAVERLLLDDAA